MLKGRSGVHCSMHQRIPWVHIELRHLLYITVALGVIALVLLLSTSKTTKIIYLILINETNNICEELNSPRKWLKSELSI